MSWFFESANAMRGGAADSHTNSNSTVSAGVLTAPGEELNELYPCSCMWQWTTDSASLNFAFSDVSTTASSRSPFHLSILSQVLSCFCLKTLTMKSQKHMDFINIVMFLREVVLPEVHVFMYVVFLFWNLLFDLLNSWKIFGNLHDCISRKITLL